MEKSEYKDGVLVVFRLSSHSIPYLGLLKHQAAKPDKRVGAFWCVRRQDDGKLFKIMPETSVRKANQDDIKSLSAESRKKRERMARQTTYSTYNVDSIQEPVSKPAPVTVKIRTESESFDASTEIQRRINDLSKE